MARIRASIAVLALSAAVTAVPASADAKAHHPHSRRAAAKAPRPRRAARSDGGAVYVETAPAPASTASGPVTLATGGAAAPDTQPSGATGPTGVSGPSGTAVGGSVGTAPPVAPTPPPVPVATALAVILPDGLAVAPVDAPAAVKAAIAAGNQLIGKPYIYGGGHASFVSAGYDCSGAVSYALHGGGLLDSPLPSGALESWGVSGSGQWITVYANAAHTYVTIAGIRLDTSRAGDASGQTGPRWRPLLSSNDDYVVRHPLGL